MEIIKERLITALNQLGLPNIDARVYAALVYLNPVGVKELVDFVGISKQSVYASLQKLEERGLVVKNSFKPSVYAAVSPNLAIEILNLEYVQAKETAVEELKLLTLSQKSKDENDAIWTVFGERNIRHKIRDMIGSAEENIICFMGERYLPLFEDLKITASITLYIVSNNPDIVNKAYEILGNRNATIIYIPSSSINDVLAPPGKKKIKTEFVEFNNLFEIIIDDKETLSIPPLRMNKLTGLHSSIDLMIRLANERMEMITGLLSDTGSIKKKEDLEILTDENQDTIN